MSTPLPGPLGYILLFFAAVFELGLLVLAFALAFIWPKASERIIQWAQKLPDRNWYGK